jgi:hypothetical protein
MLFALPGKSPREAGVDGGARAVRGPYRNQCFRSTAGGCEA